jgi:KUP system potassium uptake protein
MQAIQLGYCPRLQIEHTSAEARGQIYLPKVNIALMIACIGLVLGFRSSSNLAAAYGIAVTLTMLITSFLFYLVARHVWNWSFWKAAPITALFVLIELAFFLANVLKIPHGGWFTLLVAAVVYLFLSTWKKGRLLLGARLRPGILPLSMFLEDIQRHPPVRVKGTAIFLSGNPEGAPMALMHNLKHNKVLHERLIVLTITTADKPHVDQADRVEIKQLTADCYRIIGRFGFMEDPDVPQVLAACKKEGLDLNTDQATFFLSRETIIATPHPGMFMWRERLFSFMSRNAQPATAFFRLPPNRVVELGMQVEI